jgi:hypothetical protein
MFAPKKKAAGGLPEVVDLPDIANNFVSLELPDATS